MFLSSWKIKVLATHEIFQGLFSDEVGPSFTKYQLVIADLFQQPMTRL